jgi:ribosomal protein S18 acetylase RimI-like enzyme
MAAIPDVTRLEVVELRHVTAEELEPVLGEESRRWREQLRWDFSSSADLVRRFVRMRALGGYAARIARRVVGYCYFVCEEEKGLIGDVYVAAADACPEYENALIEAATGAMMRNPYLRRIESQLMLLGEPIERQLPHGAYARIHRRNFMIVDVEETRRLKAGRAAGEVFIEHWNEHRQEEAAQVIGRAYVGHIDSDINDQYRSVGGARRFLTNIVQYPGCGVFHPPASFLAYGRGDGRLCGICLASMVATSTGHITQICVTPEMQGAGVGYELMRRSLGAMRAHGCAEASLTVTAANTRAIALYEEMGFRVFRQFGAYVWDGF